jgi:hypothetical protein
MYPGPNWRRRVEKMSDAQVYAIWVRNQENPTSKKEENKQHDESDPDIPF